MAESSTSNEDIAQVLAGIADLLEAQGQSPHRARAYRRGADAVRASDAQMRQLLAEGGTKALTELSGIGDSLASVIREIVETGRSSVLDRLQAKSSPVEQFSELAGIGDELAQRVVDELGITTMEQLESAAHDGRLEKLEGFGEQRVAAVRDILAGRLSRSAKRRSGGRGGEKPEAPPVSVLLDVDAEYRRKAAAGDLRTIAPKRFNPEGEAWLPVLDTERGEYEFTVLFSNTKRAHDQGKTHDWVVIYYRRDGREDQCTVVTGTQGGLAGKRVVRGREPECRQYYEDKN
jgi:predicted flap endonuclease-1-like 5' DNA nuclease